MSAYYNEFDPQIAAWLRELIKAGHIAPGEVDERSIVDVRPDDLRGFTQHHFFAGIGIWSLSLRKAGWSDEQPVWTGSCPCQPFSSAGKGDGFNDERHLWPHFHWLIEQCKPSIIFGEQVASKNGLTWLDLVQADLEGSGYTSGAVDTCAAGFGAPHIRQRLYWVAYSGGERSQRGLSGRQNTQRQGQHGYVGRGGAVNGMADTSSGGRERVGTGTSVEEGWKTRPDEPRELSERLERCTLSDGVGTALQDFKGMADAADNGCVERGECIAETGGNGDTRNTIISEEQPTACQTNGYWRDVDWLFCKDGFWRSVEPGTFPLVDGAPARVVRLRGYGNAIVAPQATAFIEAVSETLNEVRNNESLRANDRSSDVESTRFEDLINELLGFHRSGLDTLVEIE